MEIYELQINAIDNHKRTEKRDVLKNFDAGSK